MRTSISLRSALDRLASRALERSVLAGFGSAVLTLLVAVFAYSGLAWVRAQDASARLETVDPSLRQVSLVVVLGGSAAFALGLLVNIALWRGLSERRRIVGVLEDKTERLAAANQTLAAAQLAAERALKERGQALAALEKSNRALDQFAFVASHDLKAPLRGIANLSQWIEEDLGAQLDGDTREHLRLLKARVHRMEVLIDGILGYARARTADKHSEPIDVSAFLAEVTELVAPAPGSVVRLDSPMPVVHAPRVPFQQIWMNLIGNALKHAQREDPEVHLASRDRGQEWEFSVKDNGPGIAPRNHRRIFELFQMLSPRDQVEGTGIGLAVVKELVEASGGRVWVESEPGTGAKFCFTWPKPPTQEARA
jgi:signal transduction histidine kinase